MPRHCLKLGTWLAISVALTHPAWAGPDEEWFGDAPNPENMNDGGDAATAEPPSSERPIPPPPEPRSAPAGARIYSPNDATSPAVRTAAVSLGTTEDASTPGATGPADAGPPTLFGGQRITFGGYGGIDVRYSRVSSQDALLVGGEGAVLLNHRLAIGGGGYGLSSLVSGPRSANGEPTFVGFGYGGLVVRDNFVNERPVYLSVGALIGAGGVGFFEQVSEDEHDPDPLDSGLDAGAFFVVEPSVGIHVNVARWMRVGASAAYRFTRGIDVEGLDDSDFSGPSAGGHVEFGWF